MIAFFNAFTKVTGWPVQKLCFRTKIYYEDKSVQSRRIKGPAIIVSNHTSVFDYAVILFVFFSRTLRYQMAEVLFKNKLLAMFLRMMGGIFIDRNAHDYRFIEKSGRILEKGGVVGIFPEGRLPVKDKDETIPLKFLPGAAELALEMQVPIIPVYTNGSYFCRDRARVIIGAPVDIADLADEKEDYKEKLESISQSLRERVVELGCMLSEKVRDEKKDK